MLLLARKIGVLEDGRTVALGWDQDPRQCQPRHSALSYEHAGKIEARLEAEVADLLAKAEGWGRLHRQGNIPDGMSIPEELERPKVPGWRRLQRPARRMERAKDPLSRTANIRQRSRRGKRRLKPPAKSRAASRPTASEKTMPTDQVNLTNGYPRDPCRRWRLEQCCDAQAVVASTAGGGDQCRAGHDDKQQLQPMLNQVMALPDTLGKANAACQQRIRLGRCCRLRSSGRCSQLMAIWTRGPPPVVEQRFAITAADQPPRRSRRWPISQRRGRQEAVCACATIPACSASSESAGLPSVILVGSTRCAASRAL